MSNDAHLSVFDRVTQEIIADLEQGVRPWQQPWVGSALSRPLRPLRHNGEAYNGVNVLLLWMRAVKYGYQNSTWMTFKQAEEYGAHVRKGEKAAYVVYANKITKTETDAQTGASVETEIPFMRGYSVFNAEQIEGLPERFLFKPDIPDTPRTVARLENVDHFIRNTGAVIRHGGDKAYYADSSDHVQMPFIEAFRDGESYYATLSHELTHWTAHKSRLDRSFESKAYADEGYAKEELVAEIGAAFLCADLGITPEVRDDHAAYIANWLIALKNDRKLIFTAAAHATRAVEFLKARQPQPVIVPDTEVDVRPDSMPVAIPTATSIAAMGTATARMQPSINNGSNYHTLYTSPPMEIGQRAWRLLIERSGRGMVTRYEFQDESGAFWHRSQDWPRHDINDTYLGLPRGLAKLYEREKTALIKHGLAVPKTTRQLGLSF